MADTSSSPLPKKYSLRNLDGAWTAIVVALVAVAVFVPNDLGYVVQFTIKNLGYTGIFITFAVFLVSYLRASGAETLVASAFQGNQFKMIILASMVGGLLPFCSCEVIPFVAALLALGTPLSAVMAFWLASPIMDPPMFLITSGTLGVDFAIAKTVAAVSIGMMGGFGVMLFNASPIFANPLKETAPTGCNSCCGSDPLSGKPVWKFWKESERVKTFKEVAIENALFLIKWLTLAYVFEALMLRFVPAEWIAGFLGGDGLGTIILGAFVGAPAYLNGYAAAPLVQGLIEQGMSQGAAMSFMMAGGVSCIPAAIAVWALVKTRVFLAYLSFGIIGSIFAGILWAAYV
ncbi:permease [Amylibacter sp. SFDW26]|uniref:permease n=1 Tax=Amylibacter sp. SFDW26 TaxID=2652722 RepID=UPI001261D7EB|nr:permease [Amylibacter sp. SFDW26]KAB7613826.1 permease [Amylibacter sp. SFDW26]